MSLSARGEATVRDFWSPYTHHGQHPGKHDKESEEFLHVRNLSPVANCVSLPIVCERLATLPTLPHEEITYDYMSGSQRTRELIARFLSTKLLNDSVSREEVVLLDGKASILNAIVVCLCEEGDRVLVPSECQQELTFMLSYRAKVETVAASYTACSNSVFDVVQSLEATWQKSGAESSRIRIVYVDSLDVYRTKLDVECDLEPMPLDRIVNWASSKGLHTVVDITNALNVANDRYAPSSWKTAASGDDVHIIWNAARFFNIPGASLCALATKNKDMLKVFELKLSYFGSTSRQSQWLIQYLLSDANFVDSYVEENQRRVTAAYQSCVEELDKMGIRYRFASGGGPILLDLGELGKDNPCLKRLISHNDILLSSSSNSEHAYLYYDGAHSKELGDVLQNLRACMVSSD